MENINKQLQTVIGNLIGKDYFKLEFGCETSRGMITAVFESNGDYGYALIPYTTSWNGMNGEATAKRYSKENLGEILGQEPTLNDVLLAIETKVSEYEIMIFGELLHIGWYEKPNKKGYYDKLYINLSKSIFNQSDETKLAIIKLLE